MLTCIVGVTYSAENTANKLSVEERLQRLEDRETIRELLIEYGRFLDSGDLLAYSKLFANDGVWEGGIGTAKGPEAIHDMLEKVFSVMDRGQYGNASHIISDVMIEVDGEEATSWSRWTWIVEGKEGRPVLQRTGHYEDILIRENGFWKFKHRLTVTELPTAQKDTDSGVFRTDYRTHGLNSD